VDLKLISIASTIVILVKARIQERCYKVCSQTFLGNLVPGSSPGWQRRQFQL